MRRQMRRRALSSLKELDAFPKVSESYVETSASGGTVSLIAFVSMALLAVLEFFVYQDTWMKYEYEVDKDFSSKMRINIDITVAMKCQREYRNPLKCSRRRREDDCCVFPAADVGADILDLAETMITSNGLQYEPTVFDLTPQQRLWQKTLLLIQSRLKEEHALQEVVYKTLLRGAPTALPPREDAAVEPLNACRIHGHIYINKVAGNLHITVGNLQLLPSDRPPVLRRGAAGRRQSAGRHGEDYLQKQPDVPVLRHRGSHPVGHAPDIGGHAPVFRDRAGEQSGRGCGGAPCRSLRAAFLPGAGDRPRRRQPRRLGHLREVRHQLPDGDGHRAAHAPGPVPGAAVRDRRGHFLHHG
ncbi:unnamed protein product [Tetraodon nigroviridis]|uniref:Endoplasmic reticulum-Golgi intermediate compartment protein n=1 Tax=Tetraodon nigroviridis TaxID=99883 RepID=Q4SAD1_TETNG|nr:unnamed protein product [Tetraodon nigroviridis]